MPPPILVHTTLVAVIEKDRVTYGVPAAAAALGTSELPGPPAEPPESLEALRLWAGPLGLEPLLEKPFWELRQLGLFRNAFPEHRFGTTLAQLFTPLQRVPVELSRGRRDALLWLRAQGALMQTALDAEKARRLARGPAPTVGPLAEAARRAEVTRAYLRDWLVVQPTPAPGELSLRFSDPPTVCLRGHRANDWAHRYQFEAQLTLEGRSPVESMDDLLPLQCDCLFGVGDHGGGHDGGVQRCVHLLEASEQLLDVLHNPSHPLWARLESLLAEPLWARHLRRLSRGVQSANAGEVEAPNDRLVFRLAPQNQGLGIDLQIVLQQPRKGGSWSKGRMVSANKALGEASKRLTVPELQALGFLQLHQMRLDPSDTWLALHALVGHPRVFLEADPVPWQIRAAEVALAFTEGAEGQLVVQFTEADGTPLRGFAPVVNLGGYVHLDHARRHCLLLSLAPSLKTWMPAVKAGATFPPEAHPELLRHLAALEKPDASATAPHIRLPPALEGEELAADQRLHLRFEPPQAEGTRVRALVRPLPDGPRLAPGTGPARLSQISAGRRVVAVRDLEAELTTARATLVALGLESADGRLEHVLPPTVEGDEQLLLVLERLAEREDVVVEWPERPRYVGRAGSAALTLRVADRTDWFGLEGELDLKAAGLGEGPGATLVELLEAVRQNRRYLRLSGNRFVKLTAELRERVSQAGSLALPTRQGLELRPEAAAEVEALAADGLALSTNQRWVTLMKRLREARALRPRVPAGLKAELRPYQKEGFQWLARLAAWGFGGVLADDMGLGKTVQAIAMLVQRTALGPALVLAPTSVTSNWHAELTRFAPKLRVQLYRDADREAVLEGLGPGDVLLMSYGLMTRDAAELARRHFATLILDEAQVLKNGVTQRSKAARTLDADWRLALSGTPLENHLGELWSLFRVVTPGLLGSWDHFRETLAVPIERDNNPVARAALARRVAPYLLRRTKAAVAPELPPRTEITISVTLTARELELYHAVRLAAVERLQGGASAADSTPSNDPNSQRFQILAELTRLRLLACHPKLVDPESTVPSSKLERTLQLIDELRDEGHRALVFSQFVSHLALVREALDARKVSYQYLDGQTPERERTRRVAAFQGGAGDVFLISLRAGGTGLNLTAADYVLHLDPWWNPAVEDQASDRAHRIGQDKPVTIYRLVSTGTLEEEILRLHGRKRDLVQGILEGSGTAGKLSSSELLGLLRGEDG